MNAPRLEESPIDHHIQAKILQKLFGSDSPVYFSALKPSEVENSLFMYHMRKLEDRGLIVRSEQGFSLTPGGARWVNYTSPDKLKPRLTPRLLINLIIMTPDRRKVLLSRRKSAVAAHLTRYLLPSGFHKYDLAIRDAAVAVAQSIAGKNIAVSYYDTYEVIYRFQDGYVHHWLLPTFVGELDEGAIPEQDYYQSLWVPIEEVIENRDGQYDQPLPEVLEKFAASQKFDYQTFVINEPK